MPREPLALDTPEDIEQRQIEGWRRMTHAEKAAMIASLTQAMLDMASAGVRQRFPDAPPREQFLRRAIVLHGLALARQTYSEIDDLDLG